METKIRTIVKMAEMVTTGNAGSVRMIGMTGINEEAAARDS